MRVLSPAIVGLLSVFAFLPVAVVGQPESSASAIRCVESADGDLRRVDISAPAVASCRGELFLVRQNLWGHSPVGSRTMPEAEAGAVVRLRLRSRAETPLPRFFVATGLREERARSEEGQPALDRILCESEGSFESRSHREFRCPAPRETTALRIEIDGFGTELVWGLDLSREDGSEAVVEVGPGVLVTGGPLSDGLTAVLEPRGFRPGDSALLLAAKPAEERSDSRLAFGHVAPAAYSVRLESAEGDVARTEVVVPAVESFHLPELRLPGRIDVPVQVEPRLDGFGEPWRITLIPTSATVNPRAGEPRHADDTGWLVLENLSPGTYLLLLEDSTESIWATQQVDLVDDSTHWIEVAGVRIEGSATIGEEPFLGELVFGTTQGSQRIQVTTDRNGDFHGLLPHEGLWKVEIRSMDLGCGECGGTPGTILVPSVEVEAGPSGVAHIEVEVPDTRIAGRVVREEVLPSGHTVRKPQPEAVVLLARLDGPSSARGRQAQIWTDADGAFEIRGVRPGAVEIGALLRDPPSESRWQTVDLRERLESAPIELVLQEKLSTTIQVTGLGSPVGGARVTAMLDQGMSARGVTGPDGTVTLALPRGGSGTLVIEAAGFGLTIRSLPSNLASSRAGARSIALVTGSGNLEIARIRASVFEHGWLASADSGTVLLRSLVSLRPDAVHFGESVTIRDLAIGAYAFCVGDGECRSLEIQPDSTTTLELSLK